MNRPYACPVCLGRGIVPAGFYSLADSLSGTAPDKCRTCLGTGIIWGRDDLQEKGVSHTEH
jgi:hypothetical protein